MNFIRNYLTVAVLLLSLESIAQKKDNPYPKRLYIGDKVDLESIVFNNVRNYPGGRARLSDFKGKYIIIDFWTKNCSSCIAAFPKMEALQDQFKDDIQILLVTKNSEDELTLLSKNSINLKKTKLPVIIGEQVLSRELFPHNSVPYHVWLNREGKVVATTQTAETNVKSLQDLISGKPLDLLVANQIFDEALKAEIRDQHLSLLNVRNGFLLSHLKYYSPITIPKNVNSLPIVLVNDSIDNQSMLHIPRATYYSMFMSFLPGSGSEDEDLIDANGNPRGYRIYSRSLEDLYKLAYVQSSDEIKKVISEGKAKELYQGFLDTANSMRQFQNNRFAYESNLPIYSKVAAKELLKRDLSRFFGLEGEVVERELSCLVLIRLGTKEERNLWAKNQDLHLESSVSTTTKKRTLFKNGELRQIINSMRLSNREMGDPLIIDETDFNNEEKRKKINVSLNCSLKGDAKNIYIMKQELARYGLGLKEELRKVKVIVLKAIL